MSVLQKKSHKYHVANALEYTKLVLTMVGDI